MSSCTALSFVRLVRFKAKILNTFHKAYSEVCVFIKISMLKLMNPTKVKRTPVVSAGVELGEPLLDLLGGEVLAQLGELLQ